MMLAWCGIRNPSHSRSHTSLPMTAWTVPGAHGVSDRAPTVHAWPTGQRVHWSILVMRDRDAFWCRPLGQGHSAEAPSAQNQPEGEGEGKGAGEGEGEGAGEDDGEGRGFRVGVWIGVGTYCTTPTSSTCVACGLLLVVLELPQGAESTFPHLHHVGVSSCGAYFRLDGGFETTVASRTVETGRCRPWGQGGRR